MSSKLEQQNTTELAKLSPANSGGSNGDGRISLELNRTEFVVTTLRLLGKHGRFIARVTAVGAALSVIVALLLPPTYTATSRLLPPDPNGSPTSAMLGMLAGNLGGAAGLLANSGIALTSSSTAFIAILRSDTVLDRLIERNQLQAVYRTRSRETARTMLADRTIIAQDRKTGVISVTVADRIPERAADLANAYIAELNRLTAELNIGAAHRERVFIEGRLKEVKQELEQASKEFSEFAAKNATLDIKDQGRALLEAAARLQGEIIAEKATLQGLQQIYTPNNVRVRTAQARVTELQRLLNELEGKGRSGSEEGPPTKDSTGYPAIRSLPVLGVAYSDLYRRTKIKEAVFETLTQQYELTKIQEAKETPSVRILDDARVPESRSGPKRTLFVLAGTFLSFLLSSLWVVGQKRWHEMEPNDPVKLLGQDVHVAFQSYQKKLANAAWWRRNSSPPSDAVHPDGPESASGREQSDGTE